MSLSYSWGDRDVTGRVSPGSSAYEDAYSLGQQALDNTRPPREVFRHHNRDFFDTSYFTESQSTDHSDPLSVYPGTVETQIHPSIHRHSEMSTQVQVAHLIQEREAILKEQNQFRTAQRYYVEEITKAVAEQQKFGPHSPEFQNVQRLITEIMQQMYNQIGTPEDAKRSEQEWNERLFRIDELLKAYHNPHHSSSAPDNNQMSAIVTSPQWRSSVDSVPAYSETPMSISRIPPHSTLMTREAYETESRSTSSSGVHKDMTLHYDHGDYYSKVYSRVPPPRSSSSISGEEQMEGGTAADVLEAIRPKRHQNTHSLLRPGQLPFQFSQESDYMVGQASTTSLPLSQSTNHSSYQRPYAMYKPSSPTSSSDNASMTSSVHHRLGSGPASEASFSSINLSQSTTSSRSGYVYRLPRPSITNSNNGSTTNILSSRHYKKQEPSTYDKFYHHHPMPKKGFQSPDEHPSTNVTSRRKQKNSQEKSERDSFSMKLEVVMSMMSALSTSSQSDSDAVKLLLALSQSTETCSVLRQSMCMNQLIKIIHNNDISPKVRVEIKAKGLEALRNIVESNSNSKVRHCERSVLRTLNKIRSHCDQVFNYIHNVHCQEPVTADEFDCLQKSFSEVSKSLLKLLKFSSEKHMHRPAILNLGGLQTMADILICDHNLPKKQNGDAIGHSSETLAITITILINLTYGDVNNKLILCNIPTFLDSLMSHFFSFNEQVMSKGAQVLRNLSCKATPEIKDCLMKCQTAIVLMEAVDRASSETTIQHITSALWNVSAHSLDNRYKVCKLPRGIESLVGLLSYNSPSGTTVIVENVGGVLKNLSSVISQEHEYRTRFREAGGLAKLVQHLKSRNKVVLANATGVLWNMSARCPENQSLLWDLGCIPLLDVLQTSHQKNIAENARGALRNLLAFGQSQGWTSRIDISIPADGKDQMHSKSTMALTSGGRHSSNEHIRCGRLSAPFVSSKSSALSAHNSSTSLRLKTSSRSSVDKPLIPNIVPIHYKSGDDIYNTPKFSRVASAPQANDEWMNYRPVAKQGNSPEITHEYRHPSSQINPSNHHKKSTKHAMKLSNGHSYSYSQSQSCDSEFQSISGASLGATSLGLSPQLLTEDGVMRGEAGNEVAYDELDIEIDDHLDDDMSAHYRHPSQAESETSEYLSIADHFVRDRESMRRNTHNPVITASKLSPGLYQHKITPTDIVRNLGTSGLALDGTAPSQDGLEPISESANDIIVGHSHSDVSRSHSNSTSSNGPDLGSKDI